jgi:hypothetical protein
LRSDLHLAKLLDLVNVGGAAFKDPAIDTAVGLVEALPHEINYYIIGHFTKSQPSYYLQGRLSFMRWARSRAISESPSRRIASLRSCST